MAAVFYVMNLKETTRNRRATFANNPLQSILSEEGQLRYIEVLNLQRRDFDDFVKRYDSGVNPHNYAKRGALWDV